MIVKKKIVPILIRRLEALNRRLPETNLKRLTVIKDLNIRKAGHKGEHSIDYHLSFLEEKRYHILHDLRLLNHFGLDYFQLDNVIISTSFITLIDVKNYKGIIQFDDQYHQLIQIADGKKRALEDPIPQIRRQKLQLKKWLHSHRFPDIPIEPLIVISNPSTIIETTGHSTYFKYITHSINLPFQIKSFEEKHPVEVFTQKDLYRLGNVLMKKDNPLDYNVLDYYGIHPDELIRGVHCPKCFAIPMKRGHGRWICLDCEFASADAHIYSIQDYKLLFGHIITNEMLRKFLLLENSRTIATNILKSMNLRHTGETKGRIYFL
ncbi:nuclease-related domain-containing protein [Siminovitchia fortis]|uniref:NERD domain-containing protein n=1 Tax=Siminovitchia fortis TaxID=254758 RepID=A0A443IN36_9BACI|nr:nuclease-related domain-containing protein [Siminovitchia fortis]RWR06945.1 NERD domain-containing protein [Siminovitchia fortis]WHY82105.1 nuclease-related domain-containing protein [Siminovitchia fortis]